MSMPHQRRGLSLVELLVAMAMSATVLGGAVAAIGLSGRTFQSAANGIQSSGAIDALAHMSSDIQLSLLVTERTATATTFWVPDRTGDGAPEQIRYAWSGTPGDPITYSMNGSTPVEIIEGVDALSLEYLVASVQGQATFATPAPPAPIDESIFDRAYTGTGTTHALTTTSWVAAIIQPALPAGGSTFQVTRVQIPMAKGGGGNVTVSLHRVDMLTARPEATALASDTCPASHLPATMAAAEFDLTNTTTFSAGDYIAIVVSQGAGGSSAADIALEPSPQYLTDGWIATTDAVGVWSINATKDIPIVVYAEINPGS
ncbi:MAG: prepilin-type N-terminal cleavage/methylation domain-containing protein [Phycisphaera sp.]|nr:MAG: prepilin-type N-terminal cleavage/methylation domain-containing protein [Phycisphaera sp.]